MKEFQKLQQNGQSPQIYSAIARPSIPGSVYVEARFPADVQLLCKNSVFYRGDIRVISIEDSLAVLGATSTHFCGPKPETWVRIKRGRYAGDVGFVRAVIQSNDPPNTSHPNGDVGDVVVAVIPRISDPRSPKGKQRVGAKRKQPCHTSQVQKCEVRPEPAFFDPDAIIVKMMGAGFDEATMAKKKPAIKVLVEGHSETKYNGRTYVNRLTDLIKPAHRLNFGSDNPTANELKLWSQCQDARIRQYALQSLVQFQGFIWPGDRVEANSGSYQNMQGEVLDTDGSTVTVQFFPLTDLPTDLPPAQLRATEVQKVFKAGDYVRVMGGANDGKEGLVLIPSDGSGKILVLESVTNTEVSDQSNSF